MPAAANTASVAPSWYEQAEPKEIAPTVVGRVQAAQERVETIAGTLQPKPISTRVTSRPCKPIGRNSGWSAVPMRSARPLALYALISTE